jgi:hypothetical protein
VENLKKNNIQKCVQWCEKHNIPYNKNLLASNIFMLSSNEKKWSINDIVDQSNNFFDNI